MCDKKITLSSFCF